VATQVYWTTPGSDKDAKNEMKNGFIKPQNELKSVPGHRSEEVNLESDVLEALLRLQQKGIDVNQLLREFLERRRKEIMQLHWVGDG